MFLGRATRIFSFSLSWAEPTRLGCRGPGAAGNDQTSLFNPNEDQSVGSIPAVPPGSPASCSRSLRLPLRFFSKR